MKDVVIAVAINGSRTSKEKNPNIPYTPQEIVESVVASYEAGASVVHIHARHSDGGASYEQDMFADILYQIRERCPILVNFSTSSLMLPSEAPQDKAWNHLVLKPDIASYNCGSTNHGDIVFSNPHEQSQALGRAMIENDVTPEVEVYHHGVLSDAFFLMKEGYLKNPFFTFCFGIVGCTPASVKNLLHLTEALPSEYEWFALAIGKYQLPINVASLLLNGHVRTGLEDNVYYRKGELAKSNAQLVERIVRLADEIGRPVASVETARTMLIKNSHK